jgi:hypothetical protein
LLHNHNHHHHHHHYRPINGPNDGGRGSIEANKSKSSEEKMKIYDCHNFGHYLSVV